MSAIPEHRVLIVLNGLGTGGAERSTAELLPRLPDAGIRGTVACLFRRGEGVQEEVLRAGHDVRFLAARSLPGRVRELRALIHDTRPDLVHTAVFESDVAGRIAARGRAPVLSSLVNSSYDQVRRRDPNVRPLRLEAVRRIDGWTARHLTMHFHAVANAVKDSAVRALGLAPERISVVYRGRDPDRLGSPGPERRRATRDALGLAADAEVLVAVGRQEWQKGYVDLLDAVGHLGRERPRLVTLVAGREGNATPALEESMARLRAAGLGDRVRFLGHRADVPDLLAAANCLVSSSLYEGIPGAVIEAMALALPVVATDLPSMREVVERNVSGLLVPPGDRTAFGQAVTSVLDDSARGRAMGDEGRRRFSARFTLERSTREMIALYRSVADASGAGGPS